MKVPIASAPHGWVLLVSILHGAFLSFPASAATDKNPEVPLQAPLAVSPITALAFTLDGSRLVSNGDRTLVFRSPRDGRPERSCPCPLAKITSIATLAGSPRLIVAGGEPRVRGTVLVSTWNPDAATTEIPLGADLVTCVASSPSGQWLAAACADHSAWLLPWKNGSLDTNGIVQLTGHSGPVLAIAFLDAGELVLTAGADRSLKVWKSATGELVRTLQYHTEAVHAIAVRPQTGSEPFASILCATAGVDRTVRVWQPGIGRMVRIVRGHGGPVFTIAWARDGKSLFTAGEEGLVRRIDAQSDSILAQWNGHSDWIYSLAVHPDGSSIATGDWTGEVKIHRVDPAP